MKEREINQLRLSQLSKAELDERRLNALKGGGGGYCSCWGCICPGSSEALSNSCDIGTGNANNETSYK